LAEEHLAKAVMDMRWWLNEVDASDVPGGKARVLGYVGRFELRDLEVARERLRRDQQTRKGAKADDGRSPSHGRLVYTARSRALRDGYPHAPSGLRTPSFSTTLPAISSGAASICAVMARSSARGSSSASNWLFNSAGGMK